MILHARVHSSHYIERPWIVWLHGFLGSHQEWRDIGSCFRDWPQLYVDLPGHGGSADVTVQDFAGVDCLLRATLNSYSILSYWLVGYSLGGRIAMYHACQPESQGLRGLAIEGGHPGLTDEAERDARARGDARWAARFCSEDLETVLGDWYQQPVFRTLSRAQRNALVALRRQNVPHSLAQMLEATSLSRQPDLRQPLSRLAIPFYYLCGERDEKFRLVAADLACNFVQVPDAGHNAHRESPGAFSAALLTLFRHHDL